MISFYLQKLSKENSKKQTFNTLKRTVIQKFKPPCIDFFNFSIVTIFNFPLQLVSLIIETTGVCKRSSTTRISSTILIKDEYWYILWNCKSIYGMCNFWLIFYKCWEFTIIVLHHVYLELLTAVFKSPKRSFANCLFLWSDTSYKKERVKEIFHCESLNSMRFH